MKKTSKSDLAAKPAIIQCQPADMKPAGADHPQSEDLKAKAARQIHPMLNMKQKEISPKEQARIERKRQKEQQMVHDMIVVYCKKHHHHKDGLCPECAKLDGYAAMRVAKCPFMAEKTFCSQCKVHCYRKKEQEQIREVMRFSGWRMLGKHPISAIRHALMTRKAVREKKKALRLKQQSAAAN